MFLHEDENVNIYAFDAFLLSFFKRISIFCQSFQIQSKHAYMQRQTQFYRTKQNQAN